MGTALIIIGLLGAIACIICLIISVVKKEKKKKSLIGFVIFFVVMIIGASFPGSQKAKSVPTEAPQSAAIESSSGTNSSSTISSTTMQSSSSAVLSSSQIESEQDTIPGIAASDITINLEKWNIPKAKMKVGKESVSYQSKTTDPDTGAELSYQIIGKSTTEITGVTYTALNMSGADSKTFLEVAKGYLGYCATVPYDGADQQKAKKWLESNIAKTNTSGKPIETTIGGVKFTLAGNKSLMRMLEVEKVLQKS